MSQKHTFRDYEVIKSSTQNKKMGVKDEKSKNGKTF